ncbi:MAG: L,D-transpeptidase, partial [Phycisphaerae bacterium]|nr:L,D-transpeptidase [Phycisphaerae bacterium]
VSIRAKQSLPIDWRLLQRINKVNPNALRVGQKLKLVRVPFHAVVRKSEYRLDLYMGDPPTPTSTSAGPDGQDPSWTFVRAFPVGLGEGNGTPEGTFVVRPRSKLVNPHWVNPRTGERFGADDPKNPIGEYWIGLEGADEASKKFTSYGLHGTIDPSSIGASKSMGCVRMAADDIALMFEVLAERVSTVRIVR